MYISCLSFPKSYILGIIWSRNYRPPEGGGSFYDILQRYSLREYR